MESNKQFDYELAFYSIDDWQYGYIDKKNLTSFLRKLGYIVRKDELLAIIRRMDLDADARLTMNEFIDGLKPFEPYSRMLKRDQIKSNEKTSKAVHSRR